MEKEYLTDIRHYIAEKFNERLAELGISRYQFLQMLDTPAVNTTLRRLFTGSGGCNADNLAYYAGLLGLEIVIRPKEAPAITLDRLKDINKIIQYTNENYRK